MSSLSGLSSNMKTFDNYMNSSQAQDSIQKYNDKFKNQKDALDPNLFEMANAVDEGPTSQIDYNKDQNAKQQIVVQQNKVDLMADAQNFVDGNNLGVQNPIFNGKALSQQQRTNRPVEYSEKAVAVAGQDNVSKVMKLNQQMNTADAFKKQKQMYEQRTQEVQRPIDLEYAKKVMPDYALHKQKRDNDMKFNYEFDQFQGRGRREADPMKRGLVIPLIGKQVQQNQLKPIVSRAQESIITQRTNTFREQFNNKVPIGPNVDVNRDVNIGRMISLQREVNKLTAIPETKVIITGSKSQAPSSVQTNFGGYQPKQLHFATNNLMHDSVVTRPYDNLQHYGQNSYIPQAINYNTGISANQITSPQTTQIVQVQQPLLQGRMNMNRHAENHGTIDFSQGLMGEINLGTFPQMMV